MKKTKKSKKSKKSIDEQIQQLEERARIRAQLRKEQVRQLKKAWGY